MSNLGWIVFTVGIVFTVTVDRARAPAFDAVVRRVLDALAIADIPAR